MRKPVSRPLTALLLAVAALAPGAPAGAQAKKVIGEVAGLQPVVEETSGEVRQLADDDEVHLADRIETRRQAWAELRIFPRTYLALGAETQVLLDEESLQATRVHLNLGRLLVYLSERLVSGFTVVSRAAKVTMTGTVVELRVADGGATEVRVYAGGAEVEGAGKTRRVPAGFKTLVQPGKPPLPPSPLSPQDVPELPRAIELEDPPLLDFVDPRVDDPKG